MLAMQPAHVKWLNYPTYAQGVKWYLLSIVCLSSAKKKFKYPTSRYFFDL